MFGLIIKKIALAYARPVARISMSDKQTNLYQLEKMAVKTLGLNVQIFCGPRLIHSLILARLLLLF